MTMDDYGLMNLKSTFPKVHEKCDLLNVRLYQPWKLHQDFWLTMRRRNETACFVSSWILDIQSKSVAFRHPCMHVVDFHFLQILCQATRRMNLHKDMRFPSTQK